MVTLSCLSQSKAVIDTIPLSVWIHCSYLLTFFNLIIYGLTAPCKRFRSGIITTMPKSKGILLVWTDVNIHSELWGSGFLRWSSLSSSSRSSVSPGPCDLCKCVHAIHVLSIRSYLLSKALESWFAKNYLRMSSQTSTVLQGTGAMTS